MSAAAVAVLYARQDSIYKQIPGCDVWDAERDARAWPGGSPVVAHPPCRAWGRMRHFAKPRHDEKSTAINAVAAVRRFGGVLEHPAGSSLWGAASMARPFEGRDQWGGWTLPVKQLWWGHEAEKATWLYVVGVSPGSMPQIPFSMAYPTKWVSPRTGFRKGMPWWRPSMETPDREKTPEALARWLVEVARLVNGSELVSGSELVRGAAA